jgi:MerR family mercuric resistance operon transcriptional regulator
MNIVESSLFIVYSLNRSFLTEHIVGLRIDSKVNWELALGVARTFMMPTMSDNVLRISQAAAHTGVSAHTIRYYERIGLLPKPARSNAGYRQYSESSLSRIRLVRNAIQFGFSLKQVEMFMNARDHGRFPCRAVRSAAAEVLADVDRAIETLRKTRTAKQTTLGIWDQQLARTPPGERAGLLESIAPDNSAKDSRVRLPFKRQPKS